MKLTPGLLMESVMDGLQFWVERMGWSKTVEVPEGDGLAFVILENSGAELMLQTFTSAAKDAPQFIAGPERHRTSVFVEVEDWDDTLKRLEGYEIALPEHVTFYGMREVGVFAPGGHVAVFAKQE
jgi:hypothetical protein